MESLSAGLRRWQRVGFAVLLPGLCALGCAGEVLTPSGKGRGGSDGAGAAAGSGGAGAGAGVVLRPGALVVRRLNRAEYNNTVKDLLGTTLAPASDFPVDDLGGEFDTVGEALSLSPRYVSAYETAAYALVDDLLAAPAARRTRIVTCDVATGGDACAQTILKAFASRAWRRPATDDEVGTLMMPIATAKQLGATPADGLRGALAAVLISPFFVFKPEILADPTSPQAQRLAPYELATRLSYAIWSSMPDDALFAAAASGDIVNDQMLGPEIDRMLADPRADSLLDAFGGQWLAYRSLADHDVEAATFPQYTAPLAQSMIGEARRFVQEFLRTDQPVADMLRARFTFVDSSLATLYGLQRPTAGVAATDFVRVDTSAAPRSGLLTLGALLTTTSLPARTSPVKRGEFVFTRLLCGTIGQPPPDVPPLSDADTSSTLTLRQRMEEHRKNPACSPCHSIMDPLGFGLEKYDAIGRFRANDGANPVDATGALPDGTTFDGAVELAAALATDPRFTDCVTRKFVTFAVGRLLNQPTDDALVQSISTKAKAAGGTLASVIRASLLSDAFRTRQGSPAP